VYKDPQTEIRTKIKLWISKFAGIRPAEHSGTIQENSMTRKIATVFIALLGVAAICAPVFAHHGGASYDSSKTVTLKGTVTDFKLTNPHAAIYFDVKDANGNVEHWASELNAPSWLIRKGWTRNSLKPGDEVTIIARPNKEENVRVVSLTKVILANGQELENGMPQ
jgi:Family of unknown function (DUF6152)